MRKGTLLALFAFTTLLLLIGILLYRSHWEWLNTRGVDNLSIFLLGSFGLATVMTPVIVRNRPGDLSKLEFIKIYLIVFAQVFGIFAAVFTILIIFGLIIELFGWFPLIVLPLLIIILPLILIGIDMFRGKVKRSPHNLMVGHGYYSFEALYLLLAQLLIISILFFLGPMGIGLILVSIADLIARISTSLEAPPIQVICYWTGVGHPWCSPALLLLLILYLTVAYIVVRYGNRIMDRVADGYRGGKERLSAVMEIEDGA